MAKTIGLKIEIDGLSQITKEVTSLEQQLKGLNDQLKNTEVGSEEYIKLKNQILLTNDALKDARKGQRDFIKDAKAADFEKGSYLDLNKQLIDLKKQYKSLSAAERESAKGKELVTKIQQLDTELKRIDGNIGQFQRNVGNYPKTFQLVTRSLTRSIPGFEAFSSTLKDAEGNLSLFGKALIGGFLAFQGAKLLDQAFKKLDEFISKINETKETVAEFSGAYGEDLNNITAQTSALADTFDTDARTISEAAQALSKNLGIGFEEAVGKLSGALVEGRGDADEYLKTITEYPEAFKEATGEVTDFSERNKELLRTNEELAQSQVEIADKLQGLNDGFKNAKKQATTGLLLVLAQIIDIFRPVGAAFQRLGESLQSLFKSFSNGGKQASIFQRIIDTLSVPIKFLANTLQVVVDIIANLINGFKDFVSQSTLLTKVFDQIANAAKILQNAFLELPFIFAGVFAAVKQLGIEFVNFFKNLSLDAQIFGQKVKGALGVNVKEALEDLKRQKAEVSKTSQSLGDAFNKAYQDAKNKADAEAQKRAKANAAAIKTIDIEAQKEALDRQRQAAKKLQQERDKFAAQEEKDARSRAALLADLRARLNDEIIKNIEDEQERQLAATNAGFQKQIDDLNKNYQALQLAAIEREKELVKIFGQNSAEVLKVQQANAEQLKAVAIEQAKIRAELEKQNAEAIAKINSDFRKKELDEAKKLADEQRAFRDEALNSEIQFIDSLGQQRELKNKEVLNRLLIQETDAKKREELIRLAAEQQIVEKIAEIRNKLQALDDQEAFLRSQSEAGIEIKQEEYDAILKARQQLNTQLSSLELQQTKNVEANAKKQADVFKQQFEKIAAGFQQGLELLDGFLDAANERQQARLDEASERSEKREEQLNKELQGATGLRRKFIQQQIDNELKAQERLDADKEKLAKKAAIQDKAIAITQSIIQGALAVVRALATGGPIAAGLAGALAAAQTAIIATKKFEDGGLITGPSHSEGGVPFTVQGRGNFEAEGGEFIVNKKATAKFLPMLQKINSVKFADGGLIGGVATSPTVSGVFGGIEEQIRSFNERTAALNKQQLETRVYLVTDDLDRDTENKNRIKKRVTLE